MNTLFPIFLKLDQMQVLLVGGGNVGLEKIVALLLNSPKANITLVSPEIREELVEFAAEFPNVSMVHRKFEMEDLEGKSLVICATDNKELHKSIYKVCKENRILVNVADTPDLCDFYLSSVVRKGDLKVAISTNGKSPTFAKRFREVLEETLPESLPELLQNLNKVRETMVGDFKQKVDQLNEITSVLSIRKENNHAQNHERDYSTRIKKAV